MSDQETKSAKGQKVFKPKQFCLELVSVAVALIVFGIPFYYVVVNSMKNLPEAARRNMRWPEQLYLVENYTTVLQTNNQVVLRAFGNSLLITTVAVILVVVIASMTGFVLSRRQGKATGVLSLVILAGLMIPPAIVPTIWVLQRFQLFPTLWGLILVQTALQFPFATLLYRSFVGNIPRELDESAMIDGCNPLRIFVSIILPLLKPVHATVIVITAVMIFNDFMTPLYFLPGAQNVTVQLTLYHFMSQFGTQWQLLFANVVLITLPPLMLFIFFNRRIVAGITGGAVKG